MPSDLHGIEEHIRRWVANSLAGVDSSFGTLWWVDEKLWKEVLPNNYISDREQHPGVSVSEGTAAGTSEYVPMLYGSSRKRRGVKVTDLSPDKKVCYFGPLLLPGQLPGQIRSWIARCFPIAQTNFGPNEVSSEKRVRRNFYKRTVSDMEMKTLREWWNARREKSPFRK